MTQSSEGRFREGTVEVENARHLGYAALGDPSGHLIFWLHGTPGARRQVPPGAQAFAQRHGVQVVGVERPGIGASTPHLYDSVQGFARDLGRVADHLGQDSYSVVGMSGGGPYALACGAVAPERVASVGVLGGVAPTRGPDAPPGGRSLAARVGAPWLRALHRPMGLLVSAGTHAARPLASSAFDLFMRFSPEGDQRAFADPAMKSMFLGDLLPASRSGMQAMISDLVLFSRPWGFTVTELKVPVCFWHGDADQFVPLEHGVHVAALVPGAELVVLPGESHLGGMVAAERVLTRLLADVA